MSKQTQISILSLFLFSRSIFVLCEHYLIKSFNKQSTNNSKKRLITGIILLSLGIILFAVTLAMGLKSIIAIVLFLLSLTMITVGVTCLFWKKINKCLSQCCPQIKNNVVDKSLVDKNNSKDRRISMTEKNENGFKYL